MLLLSIAILASCAKKDDPYAGSLAFANISQCCRTEAVFEISGTDTFYIPNLFLPARDSQETLANVFGSSLVEGESIADIVNWETNIRAVTPAQAHAMATRALTITSSVTGWLVPAETAPAQAE